MEQLTELEALDRSWMPICGARWEMSSNKASNPRLFVLIFYFCSSFVADPGFSRFHQDRFWNPGGKKIMKILIWKKEKGKKRKKLFRLLKRNSSIL
jgi:hypothetical protein